MPIFVRENLMAVLNLSNKETGEVFDVDDEQIVSIMIGGIGFALENAKLHSKLGKYVKSLQERTIDLTAANDRLQNEISRSPVTDASYWLRERSNPRRLQPYISKIYNSLSRLYQHFRMYGHPCGLQGSLCTLHLSCSPVRLTSPQAQHSIWVDG
jgi:hypothetical protein